MAAQAVAWAEEHLFDRHSAVLEHEIWQTAIDHVRGRNVSAADLRKVTTARGYIRKHDQPGVVTLFPVLEREWEIVARAREGIGAFLPFVREAPDLGGELSDEQRVALKRLSGSRDFITLFQGGAGSGKSFVLRRLAEVIERAGHTVLVIAPQRQQVVGLENDGFNAPGTVSSFLTRNLMSKDAVVLVDEAGQVGGKQMLELVRMVAHHGGRLILSGDTRQHGPVEASDALLALERYAQLRPARLETIRRQDPTLGHSPHEREQIRQYRDAVKAAASGQLAESFEKLSRMGAIVGCPMGDQQERLAQEFVLLSEQGLSSVVVAQTWPEVHRVNARVREALKGRGLIQGEDQLITALERVDLTSAQKRDPRYHGSEQVVVLNRPVRGLKAGTQGKVRGVLKGGLLVELGNRAMLIANRHLDRITVCQPLPIQVAPGDRLQIRANRQFADGSKITNGELVSVKSVARDGTIVLSDGRAMGADFREFLPGYAMTSYGSQGKTVDFVLFSDSAVRAATDRRQWYVTISRGRRGIRIFTPDKAQLQQNVIRSGDQPLALDLLPGVHANTVRQKLALGGWARWLRPWSARARIMLARVLCHHADQCSKRQVYERQTA
jgi:ATP-dependent exoDNAse (exonuclease V) alpha subunit